MEKILSQDEINALFSTMATEGAVAPEAADKEAVPVIATTRYDFCRSDRLAKEQIRTIHQLHTQLARHLTSSLSAYLRALVEVALISVEQVSYSDFLKQLADPTLFCSISMLPLHGNLAMEVSPPLAFPVIDMLLGGPGKPPAENRALTEIEMQVVEGFIKLALRSLKDAWLPLVQINPKLENTETKPQMLQLVATAEAVVAIGFEVKMGENSGLLNLCIPSIMLKMNRALFDQQRQRHQAETGEAESAKISEILRPARISLTSEIRDRAVIVQDLLSVRPGDTIQLNHPVDDPVVLNVSGVPKFYGRIIEKRGKRAFEISHKFIS
jgi:flagellar motor switch protein FliM